jgi:hypothetical protein
VSECGALRGNWTKTPVRIRTARCSPVVPNCEQVAVLNPRCQRVNSAVAHHLRAPRRINSIAEVAHRMRAAGPSARWEEAPQQRFGSPLSRCPQNIDDASRVRLVARSAEPKASREPPFFSHLGWPAQSGYCEMSHGAGERAARPEDEPSPKPLCRGAAAATTSGAFPRRCAFR